MVACQSIGRWGNFFNQEAAEPLLEPQLFTLLFETKWQEEVTVSQRSYMNPKLESARFLFGSWILRRKPSQFLRQGEITAFYLIWYGFGQ